MTTNTPNLSLVLYNATTDQSATFATFRAEIAGTALTSNFYKVDTAWGDLDTRITDLEGQGTLIIVNASYVAPNSYTATVSGYAAYTTGDFIALKLDTDSNGTVTLDINSLGSKSIMKVNASGTPVNISGAELQSSRYYIFVYDGTRWVWVNGTSADQVHNGGTSGNVVLVASDGSISGSGTPATVVGGAITGASEKTSLVDADSFGLIDSEASSALKEVTWATLKTYIPRNRSWFGV